MIPRRNIRIKVMQTLYTLATGPEAEGVQIARGERMLEEKLDRSLDLLTLLMLYMVRVTEYAVQDARKRAAKFLPSQEDRRVSTRIAENTLMLRLTENESFQKASASPRIQGQISDEWVKKIYQRLIASKAYKTYLESEKDGESEDADRQIIAYLWDKEIKGNADFMEQLAEDHPSWEDDADMCSVLIEKWIQGQLKIHFSRMLSRQKKTYALDLVRTVLEKEAYCRSLIEPKLINWDAERVALIDQLLLRMGLCELLYFPSIPTKVTMNEYIEIAKQYSTQQSGQFINGVLDKLLKELEKENRIQKDHSPL